MINEYEITEPGYIDAFDKEAFTEPQKEDTEGISGDGRAGIKIITHTSEFDELEDEWTELARESDTDVFQTYEWNRIWWDHFGQGKQLHIFTVYTEGCLAGIAPFFEDDVALFGIKSYTCLRFLGSYVTQPEGKPLSGSIPYSDYLDCIIRPGLETVFYEQLLHHFKEVLSSGHEIVLDEIPEESAILNTMIPLLGNKSQGLNCEIAEGSSSPVIQLCSSWDAYLKSLSVKDRYNARRYLKRSKKGKAIVFEVKKSNHPDELTGLQEAFIRLHQQQWNNRGFSGTFSEQRMHNFFIDISTSFYEKQWLEFNYAVPADAHNQIVAVDVLIKYKDKIYLLHRGLDENPLHKKKGPGNVLLYSRLNEAIYDGVKAFEMLRGSEEFKLRMATKINRNKKIRIYPGSSARRLSSALVKKYMKLTHHIRMEKSHVRLILGNKPLFSGISEYVQFLQGRIKHKFSN